MNDRPRLGFIGIGIMGTAMVLRLLERGWRVTVWNKEPERLPAVCEKGATEAANPREVAEQCDILLLCVLHTEAVNDVIWGRERRGRGERRRRGSSSTSRRSTPKPRATSRNACTRNPAPAGWMRPCSGGPNAARAGTLAIMAGGDESGFRRGASRAARARRERHAHGPGRRRADDEDHQPGDRRHRLRHHGRGARPGRETPASRPTSCPLPSPAASPMARLLQVLYPQMHARAFEPPTSYARQLLKDMKAVKEFAHDLGLTLPVVEQAGAQYAAHVANGYEMKDSASIAELYAPEKK